MNDFMSGLIVGIISCLPGLASLLNAVVCLKRGEQDCDNCGRLFCVYK